MEDKNRKDLGSLVSELAATHVELWHEEDKARSPVDTEVVKAKRRIDQLNQKRNDLIERIDEFTVEILFSKGKPAAKESKRK